MKKFLLYLFAFSFLLAGSCKKTETPEPEPEPEPEEVDAVLSKIDIPRISVNGDQIDVKGKIQNMKDGVITSLEISWQLDNGTTHVHNFTGLHMEKLDVFEFTHPDGFTATTGSHTLKVWISDVNGQGEDARPANDSKQKSFSVASQGVPRKALYEEFTSSTCAPCADFNTNYFNETFLNNNTGKYTLIKYQMNWPGSGDPYYTQEGGTRRSYYGVNGVPTLFLDGIKGTYRDTNTLQSKLDEEIQIPGVIDLEAYYMIDNNNNVKVKVTGTPYLSGQYTLHIVVVERETTQNATSNGETRFFNVMMKMVPDANGTTINTTDGTQFVERKSASLNGTHIEEYNDLEVVVFVQDDSNKYVLQSTTAQMDASQIDF
jgi:hypothetical protein